MINSTTAAGLRAAAGLLAAALALGCGATAAAASPEDPWEGVNRKIYGFNDAVDRWVLKPVATGYDRVTPQPVQRGITNVFDNANTPVIALNQLLQGKPRRALEDFTRFIVNTTVGIGGIFDVAARNGLTRHDEDFGQTFARWGGGQGPFVTVPFRGPATTTHVAGMLLEAFTSPLRLISPTRDALLVGAVDVVDTRASLLSTEQLISGDRYLFIRDAYLQSRDYEIHDGELEDDPFLDSYDEFDE